MLIFLIVSITWMDGTVFDGSRQAYSLEECEELGTAFDRHMQMQIAGKWRSYDARCEVFAPDGEFLKFNASIH